MQLREVFTTCYHHSIFLRKVLLFSRSGGFALFRLSLAASLVLRPASFWSVSSSRW
jgi:hypothetical protein